LQNEVFVTTIRIKFPAGRYHATPWGHHVNEGLIEWPPSPWRLLRALLSVGFAKHGWTCPRSLPDEAKQLFNSLAGILPNYRLPSGAVAHTRHYMPITEGKAAKTTKVLDAFLRFADDLEEMPTLFIHWSVTLPHEQQTLLSELLNGLSYLGRAEGWTEAELLTDNPPDDQWTVPMNEGELIEPGWEQVTVLSAVSSDIYASWRQSHVGETKLVKGKKSKDVKEDLYPDDLISCLCMDTATLQKQGWSQPPGSQRVIYRRPVGCLDPAVPIPKHSPIKHNVVEYALLALSADTKSGTLLPLMTRSLPQMEILHASWVKKLGENAKHAIVSGRDSEGKRLTGHQHAHLIPLDLTHNGRIDHVLVWAPSGLDTMAQNALLRLNRTWGKDLPDIVVSCVGMGKREQIVQQLRDRNDGLPKAIGQKDGQGSSQWISLTPFIAPRFLKGHGNNSLEGQVRAECRSRGLPELIEVNNLGREEMMRNKFMQYIRNRGLNHVQPPSTIPWCLKLTFQKPVIGPIALGYASHFGLGLFAAAD
jgi:CRISPR-associated protein Csb2